MGGTPGACLKGSLLYVAIGDIGAEVWDMDTLSRRKTVRHDITHTYHACERTYPFQLGSNVVLFTKGNRLHKMVDLVTKSISLQPVNLNVRDHPCAFNGTTLVVRKESAARGSTMWVFDWEESERMCDVQLEAGCWGFRLAKDAVLVALNRVLRSYNMRTGELMHTFSCHKSAIVAVSEVRQGHVATVDVNGSIVMWRVRDGAPLMKCSLPGKQYSFETGIPYFCVLVRMAPRMCTLLFSDDHGVHLAELTKQ